ncbi:MAG TPA: ABC transporter substrate-binding protein [Stellaceae bacterium]|jgi:NitT/TauT family transport system substrate-binding protein
MFQKLFDRREYRSAMTSILCGAVALLFVVAFPGFARAETIRIGFVKVPGYGPVFIAREKGYFADEGLTASLVPFEGAQPVAVAVAAGDIDFGVAGPSAGLFNLGGQGRLRIIAGMIREAAGFQNQAFVASNRAYEAGLTSYKDIAGHSFAITQMGGPSHYSLVLLAEKYGADLKSIRVLPLQSLPNAVSAVVGGQADASVISASVVAPSLRRADMKLIGWIGEEIPWQIGVAFTSARTAGEKSTTVERFLRAIRNGTRDYHDTFTGPGEVRKDGPKASEILAIISKYVDEPPESINVPYVDADARLDVNDILHQINWFRAQGLVKSEFEGESIIDKRYVIPLP